MQILLLFVREKDRDMPGGELGVEGEEGDMAPHLFRAAPEDNINFLFYFIYLFIYLFIWLCGVFVSV